MKDFTLEIYRAFLESAIEGGYALKGMADYVAAPEKDEKVLVLRHDVDKLPLNSLATARLQHQLGVKGTYYFRVVKESWDEDIMRAMLDLGHEVGYHYEDMALCGGDPKKAIAHFEEWLQRFRAIAPITTICMHGSPLSKFDNRSLWDHYRYQDFGIVAEPYFDLDFTRMLYITDTGRRWDGAKVAVRDKIADGLSHSYHATTDLIEAFQSNQMPALIMQNIHPQRWTDNNMLWWKELVMQRTKNVVKKAIFVKRPPSATS